MSKKSFVEIAAIIATIGDEDRSRIAKEIATVLAKTNGNFDRARFLQACKA